MSVTFSAFNTTTKQFVSPQELDVRLSNANAGQLTVLLGLDTREDIEGRGMAAGQVTAADMLTAVEARIVPGMTFHQVACVVALRALAEFAAEHGAVITWA